MVTCKPGDRIRLIEMPSDPDPIPVGTTGTVLSANEAQVEVHWDNGRTLLLPDTDRYAVVGHSDLVEPDYACPTCKNRTRDTLLWRDDCERVLCLLCSAVYEP